MQLPGHSVHYFLSIRTASNQLSDRALDDMVQWFVVKRKERSSVIIEICSYLELYFNDEVAILRTLDDSDEKAVSMFVQKWQPLSSG